MGEEELLRPAHAIFFSGCTATCAFCTAARFAFRPTYGIPVTAQMLAARIEQRQAEGARSVCFIGGDPAPHIPVILETIETLGDRRQIPAVFNSNFYLTGEALDLLDGAIDIYLPDLKFGPAGGRRAVASGSAACRTTGVSSPAASHGCTARASGCSCVTC